LFYTFNFIKEDFLQMHGVDDLVVDAAEGEVTIVASEGLLMLRFFSLAPQRSCGAEAVCFTAVTLLLFVFFISQTDISALAGRIFVILVPFDRNSLRILVCM